MTEPRTIKIFDTTLRDGEQAPGASLDVEQKVELAHRLARLGVDTIEPGFPISSPGDFRAVQRISREVEGVEICGFARAVKDDIDAAVRATQDAQRRRLHMFLSSSNIHLDFQLKKTRAEVVRLAREMVSYAKGFVDEVEFSPMDATRTGDEFLFEVLEAVIEEGATILNIPDTVGFALPEEYGDMFTRVMRGVRGSERVEFSAHCHNDLGMAVANSLAAVKAGVTHVEVTVNGIGERAGNCSLEELAMALATRGEKFGVQTNIRPEEIYATSQMVSRMMGSPIAFNKPIVGRNAFQHEAGIHQDGLLKNRSTYEIMDPERLGIPRSMIVLGKHSGRHALRHRVAEFGVELDERQLEELYAAFKERADKQKTVHDHELLQMAGSAVDRALEPYTLSEVQIVTGSGGHRVASCRIRDNEAETERIVTGGGEGPVEAAVNAIRSAVPEPVEFAGLELYSLSAGETANGEASVTVRLNGELHRGTAANRDIMLAAAEAYMAACNRAVRTARAARAPGDDAADSGGSPVGESEITIS
ncbi:2-isopropylmalate synthase [Saccharibacillus sp. CPCC 101409]|uniref:2-isopropylmalate synthase n=1 Tax=Saccharibacillus sp. CPCC 101409 TaxID=3058041 RepID=UPI00267326A6|nr:2-isopropylmalate synthase [Saccharibacillus sp. CPCC 101409]MDO3410815.1 2-isopropylmalate synthase [Saccharibacillus sp. CPCC 101409]